MQMFRQHWGLPLCRVPSLFPGIAWRFMGFNPDSSGGSVDTRAGVQSFITLVFFFATTAWHGSSRRLDRK
jgi:hypothetical protein